MASRAVLTQYLFDGNIVHVRRYHYDSHDQLRQHLEAFLDAHNLAKRLKTLSGLTPFESICKA